MVELPPILQEYNGDATLQRCAKKYILAQPTTEVMRLLSYSWLVLQHKGAITIEVFKTSNQSISQQKWSVCCCCCSFCLECSRSLLPPITQFPFAHDYRVEFASTLNHQRQKGLRPIYTNRVFHVNVERWPIREANRISHIWLAVYVNEVDSTYYVEEHVATLAFSPPKNNFQSLTVNVP